MISVLLFIGFLIIGLFLGLLGGGGSILTVPFLTYLFGYSAGEATTYSLFIVGVGSLIGAAQRIRSKQVDYKALLSFGIPSLIVVFAVRRFLIPHIPKDWAITPNFTHDYDVATMAVFALLMLLSAYSMLTPKKEVQKSFSMVSLLGNGVLVGLVTAFLGAGGGFIMVPILAGFFGLSMPIASGTSLVLIAINSQIGFWSGGSEVMHSADWSFLGWSSGLTLIGVMMGNSLAGKLDAKVLRKGFGYFVLGMGVLVLMSEAMKLMNVHI